MRRGFTLIELLIVLAIMAILSAVIIYAVDPLIDFVRRDTQAIELERVQTAVSAYVLLADAPLPERTVPANIHADDGDAPFSIHLRALPTRYSYAWDAHGEVTQYPHLEDGVPQLTPLGSTPQEIADAMSQRMRAYYSANGSWARAWSPYCYTDLELDPEFWSEPIEGVRYKPHGAWVGLANVAGDGYQVYVRTISGVELHLYDNWNVWLSAEDGRAYYHLYPRGEPGETLIPVDLATLRVERES